MLSANMHVYIGDKWINDSRSFGGKPVVMVVVCDIVVSARIVHLNQL